MYHVRQVCVMCPQAEVWGLVLECLECPHGAAENCRRWRIKKLGWQQTHLCTCMLTCKDTRRKRGGAHIDAHTNTHTHTHTHTHTMSASRNSAIKSKEVRPCCSNETDNESNPRSLSHAPTASPYMHIRVSLCRHMYTYVRLCVSVCFRVCVRVFVCVSIACASRTPTGVQSLEIADAERRRGVPLKAVE